MTTMTTRQKIEAARQRQAMIQLIKDCFFAPLILGAGFVLIFFLS